MIAALLLAATFAAPLPVVDVAEINRTPYFQQVILHRWYRLANPSHHVAQWRLAEREPLVVWRGGRRVMYLGGREIAIRSLRYTETTCDPEMANRKALHHEDRLPYLKLPKRE